MTPGIDSLSTSPLAKLHEDARYLDVLMAFESRTKGSDDANPDDHFLAASAAARLGRIEPAEGWARTALMCYQTRGHVTGVIRATNLLGALDFERGNLDGARGRFATALTLARQLGDTRTIAKATNNLANIAHLRGQTDRALRLYQTALAAYRDGRDQRGMAETWHNIALRYRQQSALRDAIHAAEQSVHHARQVDQPGLLVLCLLGLAETEVERQQYAAAEAALDECTTQATFAGERLLELEVARVRAVLAFRQGAVDRAIGAALMLRDEATRRQSALIAAECSIILALGFKATGRVSRAAIERDEVIQSLKQLGAVDLLERFELDWDEVIPASQ